MENDSPGQAVTCTEAWLIPSIPSVVCAYMAHIVVCDVQFNSCCLDVEVRISWVVITSVGVVAESVCMSVCV